MVENEKNEKAEDVFELECPLCSKLNVYSGERDELFYCEYCGCDM